MLDVNLEDEKYYCPITLEIFDFPLTTSCGHNFEAVAIYNWIEQHANCPLCKAEIPADSVLQENCELRSEIQANIRKKQARDAASKAILLFFERKAKELQQELDAESAYQVALRNTELSQQEYDDAAYAQQLQLEELQLARLG